MNEHIMELEDCLTFVRVYLTLNELDLIDRMHAETLLKNFSHALSLIKNNELLDQRSKGNCVRISSWEYQNIPMTTISTRMLYQFLLVLDDLKEGEKYSIK